MQVRWRFTTKSTMVDCAPTWPAEFHDKPWARPARCPVEQREEAKTWSYAVRLVGKGFVDRRAEAGGATARVANMWQDDQLQLVAANGFPCIRAGQPHDANDDLRQPLSLPRFPWYG